MSGDDTPGRLRERMALARRRMEERRRQAGLDDVEDCGPGQAESIGTLAQRVIARAALGQPGMQVYTVDEFIAELRRRGGLEESTRES